MKCVKNKKTHRITRVSDKLAATLVHVEKTHEYVSKSLWKNEKTLGGSYVRS